MATNDFLPFCPTDTGSNLLSESDYLAASDRTNGNQPGVASSKLNNKALRQSTAVAAQLAQMVANVTSTNVVDDANSTKLLAQMFATFSRKTPVFTKYLSGSGTHNLSYKFQVATASATLAATYSDGTTTFTVTGTISSALELVATGAAAPAASGTLTKTGGTGDSTITYYAVRAPLYLKVDMIGGGGGASGSGISGGGGGTGGAGGNTTFGTTLLVANGGGGGTWYTPGGAGGTASLGTGPFGFAITGAAGNSGQYGGSTTTVYPLGGNGGVGIFGGAGGTIAGASAPTAPAANTGCGGVGPGIAAGSAGEGGGSGGGAGGAVKALINNPLSSYAYSVAVGGTAGTAGTSGAAGTAGATGAVFVEEHYQ